MKEVTRRGGVNNIDELLGQFPDSQFLLSLARQRVRFVTPLVSGDDFLGCLAVSDKLSGYRLNYEDVTTISTIADQLSLAITTSRLYQESLAKQRLDEEMNFARAIQQQLLPRQFPKGVNYEFSAYSDPSLQVGGDYFDFINTPRGTCAVVIADASGKGMPAALLISQIQAAVRTEVRHDVPLAQMLSNVNELVQQDEAWDKFATLFFADLDPRDLTLRYSNAGHNYPILVSEKNGVKFLDEGGLLLGAFGGVSYQQGEVQLERNDVLLFYTDGLNEAVDGNDEQYGERRVLEMLKKHKHLSAGEIQKQIIEDVRSYAITSELQDDMTIIVLKIGDLPGAYGEEISAG
jgi:sigma-B regulation protein RsbU (phosphoserine phosphatase)